MRFWGKHGAASVERERPQPIDLDVELAVDYPKAATTDELNDTLDYDRLYRGLEKIVTQRSFALLEALAGACLDLVLENVRVKRATVCVRKPRLLDGATPEIEMTRSRD